MFFYIWVLEDIISAYIPAFYLSFSIVQVFFSVSVSPQQHVYLCLLCSGQLLPLWGNSCCSFHASNSSSNNWDLFVCVWSLPLHWGCFLWWTCNSAGQSSLRPEFVSSMCRIKLDNLWGLPSPSPSPSPASSWVSCRCFYFHCASKCCMWHRACCQTVSGCACVRLLQISRQQHVHVAGVLLLLPGNYSKNLKYCIA